MINNFTWELKLYSGKTWPLTDMQYNDLKGKIAKGIPTLLMPDGSIVAKANIASVERKQLTMADRLDGVKSLPLGELKGDMSGPGYQSFLKAWEKFAPRTYKLHLRKLADEKRQTDTNNNEL